MIKWLKNLLGLNGFSDGGFTGRGHVSAMADRDLDREFILPTDCRLPIPPQPEYNITWPGKDQGKPLQPIMWMTVGYVSAPPSDKGCGRWLATGQYWSYFGETDMGQTAPALCTECGGKYKLDE